jgi:hypothetical protein
MQKSIIFLVVIVNLIVTAAFTTFQSVSLLNSLKRTDGENPEITHVIQKLESAFNKINQDQNKMIKKLMISRQKRSPDYSIRTSGL